MSVVTINSQALLPEEPNAVLIEALEELLSNAKSGQLRSYIGFGFTVDGLIVKTRCDFHDDPYQVLGAFEVMKAECVRARGL